jgi:anti-sigma B factor antagonist
MKIERSEQGGVTVVALEGVIRLGESAKAFSTYLEELLQDKVPAVLIDLSGIDHVDSTGLGELVGYLQRFTDEGRRLALLNPHRRILNLLRLTRLDDIFPIFEDEDTAITDLTSQS